MKKSFYLVISLLILIIFPTVVKALPMPSVICASDFATEILAGRTSTCDYYLDMNGTTNTISGFNGTITTRDLEYENITYATGWSGNYNPTTGAVSVNHSGTTTTQKMFTIEYSLIEGTTGEDCANIDVVGTFSTGTIQSSLEEPDNPNTANDYNAIFIALGGIMIASVAVYISHRNKTIHKI